MHVCVLGGGGANEQRWKCGTVGGVGTVELMGVIMTTIHNFIDRLSKNNKSA